MGKENNQAPPADDLQKKVAELESALAAEANASNALQLSLDSVTASNEQFAKLNEELRAENETLKAVNDSLTAEVEKLSEKDLQKVVDQAKAKPKPELSKETFEVDGAKYGFVSPVMQFKKQVITCSDVLASKELQAQLVAANSGMIKKIN